MPYHVSASFTAHAAHGVTRAQVREALAPLMEYAPLLFGDAERDGVTKQAWFDGTTIGVRYDSLVSTGFHDTMESVAERVGELSQRAFKMRYIDHDAADPDDGDLSSVHGPTPEAIARFQKLCATESLLEQLAASCPAPVGGIDAHQLAGRGEGALVARIPRTGSGDLVATLNLKALKLRPEQAQPIAALFRAMAALINEHMGEDAVFVADHADVRPTVALWDVDVARMSLPQGRWEEVERKQFFNGWAFDFEEASSGRRMFVKVECGAVTECRDGNAAPAAPRQRG